MRTVKLHLGAHKTATTYMQIQIERHVPAFSEGQYFIPLKEMRTSVTRLIVDHQKTSKQLRNAFDDYRNFSTLILSDENISGAPANLKNGILYRNLKERCIKIRDAFSPDVQFEVYFGFRDYRDFIPSLYCEYLRHNDFCTFEHYLSSSNYRSINWVSNYDVLASVFGKDSIVFFNFDRFSFYESWVMEKLLPQGCKYRKYDIEPTAGNVRASYSNSAIQLLDKSRKYLDGNGTKQLALALNGTSFLGKWLDNSKFRPLKKDGYLEKKYLTELSELKKRGCYI